MKITVVILAVMLFGVKTHAQTNSSEIDSTSQSLKTYLSKNIKFPAVALENGVQGSMIIGLHLNSSNMIDSVWIERPLSKECDSEVMTQLKSYSSTIHLPRSDYTIGFHFIIQEEGEPAEVIKPIDKTKYKDLLFDLTVTGKEILIKHTVTYH